MVATAERRLTAVPKREDTHASEAVAFRVARAVEAKVELASNVAVADLVVLACEVNVARAASED
jgi:hypothetical protein